MREAAGRHVCLLWSLWGMSLAAASVTRAEDSTLDNDANCYSDLLHASLLENAPLEDETRLLQTRLTLTMHGQSHPPDQDRKEQMLLELIRTKAHQYMESIRRHGAFNGHANSVREVMHRAGVMQGSRVAIPGIIALVFLALLVFCCVSIFYYNTKDKPYSSTTLHHRARGEAASQFAEMLLPNARSNVSLVPPGSRLPRAAGGDYSSQFQNRLPAGQGKMSPSPQMYEPLSSSESIGRPNGAPYSPQQSPMLPPPEREQSPTTFPSLGAFAPSPARSPQPFLKSAASGNVAPNWQKPSGVGASAPPVGSPGMGISSPPVHQACSPGMGISSPPVHPLDSMASSLKQNVRNAEMKAKADRTSAFQKGAEADRISADRLKALARPKNASELGLTLAPKSPAANYSISQISRNYIARQSDRDEVAQFSADDVRFFWEAMPKRGTT